MFQSVISIDVIDHDRNELIQSTSTLIVSEPPSSNNYLAIDCNLESYSSLSSSSSSSSCSSAAESNTVVSNTETSNLQLLASNKSASKTNGSCSSLFKNKIINSLKRRNSLHLSNEYLSSDEGYVGSYSDINKIPIQSNNSNNLVDQQQKQIDVINLLMNHLGQYLNEQEKVNLINYLVNHKFDLHNNESIINQTNLLDYEEETNFNSFDYDNLYEMNSISYNEDESSYKIEIPPLFDPKNEPEISHNSYIVDNDYFDISNRLNFNHNFHILNYNLSESINDPYCCYFCDFYEDNHHEHYHIPNVWEHTYQTNIECLFRMSNYELRQLCWEMNEKKLEDNRRMELELMDRENWRLQLRKLTNLKQFQSELIREDEVDIDAYLNEIDMNIDYLQYDSIYLETSTDTLNDCIDQLLKFQNNKMAFNLRKYHLELEKSNMIKRIFENFDNIPEFRPIIINDQDNKDEYIISNEVINGENNDINNNDFMIDIENLENDSLSNINNNEEDNTLFLMDTTLAANQDHNNQDIEEYLTLTEEGAVIIQNNEYYQENFDYEDYEDQLYIDSLTEEEALILLRSESELYALQMAQAAKTGILKEHDSAKNQTATATTTSATTKSKKSKKSKKKKRRFNSSESASTTTTKNTDETSSTISVAASQQKVEEIDDIEINDLNEDNDTVNKFSNVDIFENVFNYQQIEEHEAEEDEETRNALVPTVIDDSYYYNNSEYFIIDQHYDPISNQIVSSSSSNISLSLRNSLLKLRHSRRHLAALMEAHNQKLSKKAASNSNGSTTPTSSNSTTSSLTTTSNMSLYKQHLLNIQSSNCTSKKPCVYILNEGRCMRSDCRFVHDLKSITCKYWLEGECLKGETCEFLHDYVPTETSTTPLSFNYANHKSTSFSSSFGSTSSNHFSHKSKQNKNEAAAAVIVKKKDFKLDTEEFPALGGGPSITSGVILNQTGAIIETNSPVISINQDKNINNKNDDLTESNVNTPKPEVKNLASVLKQHQSNPITSTLSAAAPVKTAASVLLSNVINKTNTSTKPLNIVGSTSSKTNNNTQKLSTKETTNSSSKSSNLNSKKQNSTNNSKSAAIISDENSSKTSSASSKKKIKLNNSCSSSQTSLNNIDTAKITTKTAARATINNNNLNNNHKKK